MFHNCVILSLVFLVGISVKNYECSPFKSSIQSGRISFFFNSFKKLVFIFSNDFLKDNELSNDFVNKRGAVFIPRMGKRDYQDQDG
jgi:hypothetical protein